jgi:glutaredoxin
MKRILMGTAAAVALLFGLLACADTAGGQARVIIYGSDSCGICVQLRNELDRSGIEYVFRDVNEDPRARDEALAKMADEPWYDGVFRTPVLEINGELYERPSLEEVEDAL